MDESNLYPIPAENGRFMFNLWGIVVYLCIAGIVMSAVYIGGLPTTAGLVLLGALGFALTRWMRRSEAVVEADL